jgi:hypothetical protein
MLAILHYPPDLTGTERYRKIFEHNRLGYYGSFIAYLLLDIVVTAMRDGNLLHPVWYLPFTGQFFLLMMSARLSGDEATTGFSPGICSSRS